MQQRLSGNVLRTGTKLENDFTKQTLLHGTPLS
jgi:hypothetical protein